MCMSTEKSPSFNTSNQELATTSDVNKVFKLLVRAGVLKPDLDSWLNR